LKIIERENADADHAALSSVIQPQTLSV
jgi:hypothetical protein